MAGLMTPRIAARRPVERIVLVAAMIPQPEETGLDWWQATGQAQAQHDYLEELGFSAQDADNPENVYLHDFEAELKAESLQYVPVQHSTPLQTPVPFDIWPKVPTHVIAAASDRLFPVDFMPRQAHDRLGLEIDVMPGGHLAVLTQPEALARLLLHYAQAQ